MQPAQAFAPNATTFLTHIVGLGLADKRYVVQRFKSMLDGDIRPVEAEAPKGSRRRTAKRVLATASEDRVVCVLTRELRGIMWPGCPCWRRRCVGRSMGIGGWRWWPRMMDAALWCQSVTG